MKALFDRLGFAVVHELYAEAETTRIISCIKNAQSHSENFRQSADLFAIRQFFKEVPQVVPLIFNQNLKNFIHDHFGPGYFAVKSIYFDKPERSNWFVAWHQDLTISVDQKTETAGFGPWTVKHRQYAVQPPREILENIFTIRIHLDDTNENNGALKVIPGSHINGTQRMTEQNLEASSVMSCNVKRGGIMLMKPLLFHSSGRTSNSRQRRVIHIEFSDMELPSPLRWAEKMKFDRNA